MSARWKDIGSDVDWREHGGLWARHIEGTRYHVIRFSNDGRHAENVYACDLFEVDLDNPQLDSARESCGYAEDWRDDYGDPLPDDCKVAALAGYGAAAPLWNDAGPNAHALVRAAKRESRMLARDPQALEERLDRPVNLIGTSARNYGLGIIFASDRR